MTTESNIGPEKRKMLSDLLSEYMSALKSFQREKAIEMVLEASDGGVSVREIYLWVLQPCQIEVGNLWETNSITVMEEHYFSAVTQYLMSMLYPRIQRKPHGGKGMMMLCVGGELHEIGARMVADFLEMEGWNVDYFGANTPTSSIVEMLKMRMPDLLGISVTISYNIPIAKGLIQSIRELPEGETFPVMVGGRAFNLDDDMWRKVGADGHARDAEEAVSVAESLPQEAVIE
jgi:methanogenic corrinoid protein MtbC1